MLYSFFLLRPLSLQCHSTFFLRWSQPLPDQPLGEHTGLPSHMRQYLFSFGLSMQLSFAHSLTADRNMVVGYVPTDHTCSFMYTSHTDMTADPHPFYELGSTLGTLVCSYDISHSRAQKASITSLAATSVSQPVTHLSTNQAQSCSTSVIRPWTVTSS